MTTLCKCGMEWDWDDGTNIVRHCKDCPECRGELLPDKEPEEDEDN